MNEAFELQPSTHVHLIRETLEEERKRRAWALRNHPSSLQRELKKIEIALQSLSILERKIPDEA